MKATATFFEKLESQLEPAASQVIQLAAEMLWFMLLCPSNVKPETKRQNVAKIWQWSGQPFNPADELWSDAALDGIGSSGTSFNTNRPRELVYFIKFTAAFLQFPQAERAELASTPWLLAEWLEQIPENNSRQLRHMLLYLLFPDTFERIFGGTDRRAIVVAFTGMKKREVGKLSAMQVDKQLGEIRAAQEAELQATDIDFYVSPLRELWKDAGHKQWLFTWNPDNWDWDDLADVIARTASGESVICRWSCANSNVAIGDKVWLLRLGKPPKGIFAVGNVVSEPYEDDHWNTEKRAQSVKSRYVDIEFTRVLDVYKDQFVAEDDLANIKIDKQNWLPQSSGIEIQSRSAGLLEKLWTQLTTQTTGTVSALAKLKDPVNIIYYGPPGTGKTYELNSLLDKYTSSASAVSKEQWLAQELQPLRWFDVVVMALNDLGGSAKVAAIEEHIFVQQKAKAVGRTRHIRAQIWATLQTHTVETSETVNYSKRQAPYVFDKSTASVWRLSGDWQEACEDQLRQASALQAGPNGSKAQRRYKFVTFHQAYSLLSAHSIMHYSRLLRLQRVDLKKEYLGVITGQCTFKSLLLANH